MRSIGLICLLMIASTRWVGAAEPGSTTDQSKDAAALERRGAEYAARRDFKDALPDLEKASELTPRPDYLDALGYAQWQSGQTDLAMQSVNKALALKPTDVPALLTRARLQSKDHMKAKADLDAIDRMIDPNDQVRLDLGLTYDGIGESTAAVRQYDLWLAAHREDPRNVVALDGRCRALAEANQKLDEALKNCNEAIRRLDSASVEGPDQFIHTHPQAHNPDLLGSRGFVQLRLGAYDRAIRDYDVAVAGRPKTAEYRFARGLAELRAGRQDKGRADIAAATAMEPDVAERFAAWGLKP